MGYFREGKNKRGSGKIRWSQTWDKLGWEAVLLTFSGRRKIQNLGMASSLACLKNSKETNGAKAVWVSGEDTVN